MVISCGNSPLVDYFLCMDYFDYVASTTDMLATSFFGLFNEMIPVLVTVVLPIVIVVSLITMAYGYLKSLVSPR